MGEPLLDLFAAFNALSNANKEARQKLKKHGDGAAEG
jgi:hypothetical protein